jgi:glycosyltransferase involved in cell wall biosynthesis
MNNPDFSVVVPVFNSQPSLEELSAGLLVVFSEMEKNFELIFVDDCSTDQSWQILQKIQSQNRGIVRIIRLSRNFGQHNATLCGMRYAKGQAIITIDDDLQTPPEEIRQLIRVYEETGCDVVYGVAANKKSHSLLRNAGSRLIKESSRSLRNTPGEGSSFRLIRSGITKQMAEHTSFFVFIDEMLLWYTDNIRFVPVTHLPRKYDQSNYSVYKLWKLVANLVIFYTDAPLKVMVYGGFFTSFISFVMGVIYIIKKLFFDVPLGYTSLIVAILFSTSIILFSLGIIGEYLNRIYKVQNRKPPYAIKNIIE